MNQANKKKLSANKGGLTLVETLVAIGIFTIGMLGFTLLFSSAWRNNAYTLEMGQSAMTVSQSINTVVDYLRSVRQADNGNYPIKSAGSFDLVVYSDYDRDGVTERLHFYLDFNGQQVLMGVTKPTSTMPKTYPNEDQTIITIATKIVNTASDPIFYYYDKNYAGGSTQAPLSLPVTVADIRLMKIHLKININPYRAPDNIEQQTFVEMRNLNDFDRVH